MSFLTPNIQCQSTAAAAAAVDFVEPLSVPCLVTEMTCHMLSGTLNFTHSLTLVKLAYFYAYITF